MNWTTQLLFIAVCLTGFAGKTMAVETNIWKGIQAVSVESNNEAIRIAVEAEFRRFRIPIVNNLEEAGRLRVAIVKAYIRELPLKRRDGMGDGTAWLVGVRVVIAVTTPGGGIGMASIHEDSTFGVTGVENANRVAEINRSTFLEMTTQMANAFLKDNP